MRLIVTILTLFTCELSFAQDQYELINAKFEGSGISKLIFTDSPDAANRFANDDIANGEIYLILHSGEAPTVYSTDSDFEKNFSVLYYEFGCVGPEQDVAEAYDSVVFEHLQQNFGKDWRKRIRKDVVGFKTWKKKN
ncbi:hypothetical protein [Ekhidna sp. To15]|uniref:FEKKY domain-containing protein n=1 Tax=Ekhidna sp. To15 TaxID=3395267 RepID=UPI003F52740B